MLRTEVNLSLPVDDPERIKKDVPFTSEEEQKQLAEEAARAALITYKDQRKAEYPITGDQLDEIWRVLKALKEGQSIPQSAVDMMTSIEAIKTKYPKG